jgi:hypothetical protein
VATLKNTNVNLSGSDLGRGIVLPKGTDAQRPGNGNYPHGALRFNTDRNYVEMSHAGGWCNMNSMSAPDGASIVLDPLNYDNVNKVWYDSSGNDNNAAVLGGNPGKVTTGGGYVTMNGTSDYFQIDNRQKRMDYRSGWTLIMWMYTGGPSGRRNPWDQAYGGYGTWTHEQGEEISWYVGDNGGNGSPYWGFSSATVGRNQWVMMSATRDVNNCYWYRNGSQTSSRTTDYAELVLTTADVRIGTGYAGYWEGRLGPIISYDRALTSTEISHIWESYRGRYGV